jgi:hypothetical protein
MNLSGDGCMRNMQKKLGSWEQSQHLLKDIGNTKTKFSVEMASRRTFRMHTDF